MHGDKLTHKKGMFATLPSGIEGIRFRYNQAGIWIETGNVIDYIHVSKLAETDSAFMNLERLLINAFEKQNDQYIENKKRQLELVAVSNKKGT